MYSRIPTTLSFNVSIIILNIYTMVFEKSKEHVEMVTPVNPKNNIQHSNIQINEISKFRGRSDKSP